MKPGHNNPPDMAATAEDVSQDLGKWMAEHPVIETEEEAREGKVLLDRGNLCLKDLEAERKLRNKPYEDQIKTHNDHYRPSREGLTRVAAVLSARLGAFVREQELIKLKAAQEAIEKAKEAERLAREAEAREQEAMANAAAGELGINVAEVTKEADAAFQQHEAAQRAAARAEKETTVRVGGGFRRAIGLRTKEELFVVDAIKAIADIGITSGIEEAILKDARAYRRIHGELPTGVLAKTERTL